MKKKSKCRSGTPADKKDIELLQETTIKVLWVRF